MFWCGFRLGLVGGRGVKRLSVGESRCAYLLLIVYVPFFCGNVECEHKCVCGVRLCVTCNGMFTVGRQVHTMEIAFRARGCCGSSLEYELLR